MKASMKRKEITILDVANALTVDQWFDKFTFASKIGTSPDYVNRKLRILVTGGYLETKQGPERKLLYRMTIEMKSMMIEREALNKQQRGKPKDTSKISKSKAAINKMIASQKQANRETAERMLRSVNFI